MNDCMKRDNQTLATQTEHARFRQKESAFDRLSVFLPLVGLTTAHKKIAEDFCKAFNLDLNIKTGIASVVVTVEINHRDT
jgi:hypothetical protein